METKKNQSLSKRLSQLLSGNKPPGKDTLIILIIAGILLLAISWPTDGKTKTGTVTANLTDGSVPGILSSADSNTSTTNEERPYIGNAAGLTSESEIENYRQTLTRELKTLISQIEGAGHTEVMISFENTGSYKVEKETSETYETLEEKDATGGTRQSVTNDKKESTVNIESGNGTQTPFVSERLMPRVSGVLVVTQGGADLNLRKNITEAICALFDIEAHKISVVKMASTK